MTMAEKILAAHCGRDAVSAGEFVNVRVDVVLANDITAPISIREFRRLGRDRVFDKDGVILVPDHFTPNKDIKSAEQAKVLRDFVREQGLTKYREVGEVGIEHALLPEQGWVLPGDVVVGADSHTCTYGALGAFATGMGSTDIAVAMAMGEIWMKVPPTIRVNLRGDLPRWVGGKDVVLRLIGDLGVDGALYQALEFGGEALEQLNVDNRLTVSNMAIEAGGKAGLFQVDEIALDYVRSRAEREYAVYEADGDASYARVVEYDLSDMEPQVAFPHLPSNVRPVSAADGVSVDQVVIGSCTNGRLSDLRVAAEILRGRKVAPYVRCIVIPGTQTIYLDALREGLVETFIEAGVAVSTPTCGPCLGGHMGILAAGERCISTTNRNFVGRMGSPQSEVYLAGPAVAAASAVLGRIGSPEEVMG
jgi:3-isopropylmalate/(R)-2-methylmalate dehydratase large subunit